MKVLDKGFESGEIFTWLKSIAHQTMLTKYKIHFKWNQ